jgi:hypothetical protein
MLFVSAEQMAVMESTMMKRFIDKTLDFIRINFLEWSSQQTDDVLTGFVRDMIKFAQDHEICKEISIQKLIEYQIDFKFSIPLRSQLENTLRRPGLDEDSRLEYFKRQIEDLSPLIKLKPEDPAENES